MTDKKLKAVGSAPEVEAEELPKEPLPDQDRMALEMAKMGRKLALANAEKALAENNAAELAYRNLALQLFMKHGLDPAADIIDEQGNIIKGGAEKLKQSAQPQ